MKKYYSSRALRFFQFPLIKQLTFLSVVLLITLSTQAEVTIDNPAASQTVECDGSGNTNELDLWLDTQGGAQASTSCETPGINWSYAPDPAIPSGGCGATGSVTVTFTATDACGDTALTTATFSVVDTTAPSLTGTPFPGTSGTNACMADAATAAPFSAADAIQGYTDNCGGSVTATLTNTIVDGTDCNWTVTYSFTVTDACGNALTGQTYTNTGVDQTAPSLTGTPFPGTSGTNACMADAATAAPFSAADAIQGYTDNCGSVTATLINTVVDGTDCAWTVTYTFTVSDACGNALAGQTYTNTGGDQTAPSLTGTPFPGTSGTNACMADAATAAPFSTADAIQGYTDNCGGSVTAALNTTTVNGTDCAWTVTYSFTVTDACANELTGQTYTNTGGNTNPPVFSTIEPFESLCSNPNLETKIQEWLDGVTARAACGDMLTVEDDFVFANLPVTGCSETVVTFTATDLCNNLVTTTSTIHIFSDVEVSLAGPDNLDASSCEYADQAALDAAFKTWIETFDITEAGCGVTIPDLTVYTAPDLCAGGTVSVTYNVSDGCTSAEITRSFKINSPSPIQLTVPAPRTIHNPTSEEQVNNALTDWLAEAGFEGGCNEPKPELSRDFDGMEFSAMCGGDLVVTWTVTSYCETVTASSTFSVSRNHFKTKTSGDWTTEEVWEHGCVPSHSGGLPNYTTIDIEHDVDLVDYYKKPHNIQGTFQSNQNTPFLDIYVRDGATWFVQRDVYAKRNMSVYIQANSTMQVGSEPPDCYDFCLDENPDCDYESSLFKVEGSASGGTEDFPGLFIREAAIFHLYGDIVVNNNFEINVSPGGLFIVEGSFTGGNNAEVSFYGRGDDVSNGYVGCGMNFTNSGTIIMDGANLDISGDLLFGNSSDIYLNSSILSVTGEICSFEGIGDGAVITAHHGYWEDGNFIPADPDDVSQINAGYFCAGFDNPDNIPLPVDLLSFTSEGYDDFIELLWITASELNNDFFTIERSTDARTWEIVGYKPGAGTTSEIRQYRLNDHDPVNGLSYYRLKQTDFDGQYEYFRPISVSYAADQNELDFRIVKNKQQWTIYVTGDGEYNIELYSLTGQKLYSGNITGELTLPAPQHAVVVRIFSPGLQSVSRVVM